MLDRTINSDYLKNGGMVWIQIEKKSIINKDFTLMHKVVSELKKAGKFSKHKMHISFNDYDNTDSFICEIPEIREWVRILLEKYPYIPYFISNESNMMNTLLCCICDFTLVKTSGSNNGIINAVADRRVLKPIIDGTLTYGVLSCNESDVTMTEEIIRLFSFISIKS